MTSPFNRQRRRKAIESENPNTATRMPATMDK